MDGTARFPLKGELPPHVRDPAGGHAYFAGKFTGVDSKDTAIWTRERWLAGYTGEVNCEQCGRNGERSGR